MSDFFSGMDTFTAIACVAFFVLCGVTLVAAVIVCRKPMGETSKSKGSRNE